MSQLKRFRVNKLLEIIVKHKIKIRLQKQSDFYHYFFSN